MLVNNSLIIRLNIFGISFPYANEKEMFKNHLITAFRTLKKNKGFTGLNVLGLTIGLATCFLIVLYVKDELSFDLYNQKAARIYRVNEDLKLGSNRVNYACSMAPLADALKRDFPQVENAVRLKRVWTIQVEMNHEKILEENALFADPGLFDVFTLPMIYGKSSTALLAPNSVVITAEMAKKYFNRLNVLGQNLVIDNNQSYKITGIIQNIPSQSHFKADFFLSMASLPDSRLAEWLRSNFNTYVLLKKGADPQSLQASFPKFLKKYSEAQMKSELNMSYSKFEKGGNFFSLNLMPLSAIHLTSNMTGELGSNGTIQYVYIFSAIALFILILACVNFINLSTARFSNRAKEVGVRKVLGSARKNLIHQFLIESTLLTLFSTCLAFVLCICVLPLFNEIAGKNLSMLNADTLYWAIPAIGISACSIGILAGSYPAFFLSSFKPIDSIKGSLSTGFKGKFMRSFLVVFQFSISIFLITGTLVIYSQLKFIQTRDLGYNRNHVLIIQNAFELGNHVQTFKQEMKALREVSDATLSGYLPTASARNTSIFYKDATQDPKKSIFPQTWSVDEDYLSTLGMKLVAGRNFSMKMPTDSDALILNETAAKFLGFSNPINKMLYNSGGAHPVSKPYHIIGIVKDFNFNSLRQNISPVIMKFNADAGNLTLRINTDDMPGLLKTIESRWKTHSKSQFQYSFMNADFDATYSSEMRAGKISITFTVLALIIACLGLFGLATFAAEQRIKEIGIRKVLGASVISIVAILSKDFIKLVFLAFIISSPLAFLSMKAWLDDFAYRTNFQWWILIFSGFSALFISLLSVGFQSYKAATANPIQSLRTE